MARLPRSPGLVQDRLYPGGIAGTAEINDDELWLAVERDRTRINPIRDAVTVESVADLRELAHRQHEVGAGNPVIRDVERPLDLGIDHGKVSPGNSRQA